MGEYVSTQTLVFRGRGRETRASESPVHIFLRGRVGDRCISEYVHIYIYIYMYVHVISKVCPHQIEVVVKTQLTNPIASICLSE